LQASRIESADFADEAGVVARIKRPEKANSRLVWYRNTPSGHDIPLKNRWRKSRVATAEIL
jgi:hypothetical protein